MEYKELRKERIRAAKRHLIRETGLDLDISPAVGAKSARCPPDVDRAPPPELVEVILLLSSQLNAKPLDTPSRNLLESSELWQCLKLQLPHISTIIASHLHTRALLLSRILSPTTNPSYLHRTIPKVCPMVNNLQTQITNQTAALAKRRISLVNKTLQVVEQYQRAIELTVSHLEQTTHGTFSEHIKAKSEYISVQALSVSLLVKEKETSARQLVYTKQVQRALGNYAQHLRVEKERINERTREAERILWGYGVGRDDGGEKEKVMREIARMYGIMKDEIESVERDVGRLRGK